MTTLGPSQAEPQTEELRSHFDKKLDEVQQGLVEMGSLVTDNLRRAGEAMRETRFDLIDEVRRTDNAINERYIELERRIFETLALQAPVARDLRFLVAATRILYEQERSGDLVVNCVNMLEREDGFPDTPALTALLSRTVDASARVFAQSVDAIADMAPKAGRKLDRADDEVDGLVSQFYTMIGAEAERIGLETAIALSRVGRYLERIADHAVNIGENITYISTGEYPNTHRPIPSDEV